MRYPEKVARLSREPKDKVISIGDVEFVKNPRVIHVDKIWKDGPHVEEVSRMPRNVIRVSGDLKQIMRDEQIKR